MVKMKRNTKEEIVHAVHKGFIILIQSISLVSQTTQPSAEQPSRKPTEGHSEAQHIVSLRTKCADCLYIHYVGTLHRKRLLYLAEIQPALNHLSAGDHHVGLQQRIAASCVFKEIMRNKDIMLRVVV